MNKSLKNTKNEQFYEVRESKKIRNKQIVFDHNNYQ